MLPISKGAYLRLLNIADAPALHSLIEENRAYLARWLAWAPTHTLGDTSEFIRAAERQVNSNDGFRAAIISGERLVGVAGYMGVNWRHRRTALAYWLGARYQGQGVMTDAVRSLADHALLAWKLNRVEIRVASGNQKSQAIPKRLGFKMEAILSQTERINDHYHDTLVYAMLASDWRQVRQTKRRLL